jgi:hypothetical protein
MYIRFQTAALLIALLLPCSNLLTAQSSYSPQIGTMVYTLEDLKTQLSSTVKDLSVESTDFLPDATAHRIGSRILHLAAAEKYNQVLTIEGREFNATEQARWQLALELGDAAREEIVGQPISYYLDIWDEVRQETLSLLEQQDDQWLNTKVAGTNLKRKWYWYNAMEEQARQLEQISMMLGKME